MHREKKLNCFYIAIKNLDAQIFRSLFMMLFVLLMSSSFFFSNVLMENMRLGITNTTERMGADIIVIPKEGTEELRDSLFSGTPCSVSFSREWEERIANIEGVKRASPQLYIATLDVSCCDAAVQMIAFEPETDFVVKPWLSEQKELNLKTGEIVAGYNLAADVGDTVKFYDTEFTVGAKLEKSGMGYDNSVFMTFDTIYTLADSELLAENLQQENLEDMISMVMVDVDEGITPGVFKIDIQDAYPNEDSIYACTADDLMSGMARQVEKLSGYGNLLIFFLIISTALALISIFMLTINERKYEFGILYTLGAKKRQITKIILTEALLISLCGGIAGIILAISGMLIFGYTISARFDIPYLDMSLEQIGPTILICLGISLLTGAIAACCSAYRISKEEPYRLIREKE